MKYLLGIITALFFLAGVGTIAQTSDKTPASKAADQAPATCTETARIYPIAPGCILVMACFRKNLFDITGQGAGPVVIVGAATVNARTFPWEWNRYSQPTPWISVQKPQRRGNRNYNSFPFKHGSTWISTSKAQVRVPRGNEYEIFAL